MLSKKDKKKKEMEDLNALLAEMGMYIVRFIINPYRNGSIRRK